MVCATVDPFTRPNKEGNFHSGVHLGAETAALLVDRSFVPQAVLVDLPGKGSGVLAVAHAQASSW